MKKIWPINKKMIRFYYSRFHFWVSANKKACSIIASCALILSVYLIIKLFEGPVRKYSVKSQSVEVTNQRILQTSYGKVLKNKDAKRSVEMKQMQTQMKQMLKTIGDLNEQISELKDKKVQSGNEEQKEISTDERLPNTGQADARQTQANGVQFHVPPENFGVHHSGRSVTPDIDATKVKKKRRVRGRRSVLSFPVESKEKKLKPGVVLPSGSYVRGIMLTGVEAPEGKTYPVLIQLDYAYIIPNDKKLDLAGCFLIAKASGDLSTERVQMQATKISCVSKSGRMFERKINGFVADNRDNSFAVTGRVNSKQDRVASMAFLSSIVEGIGKAIQQAQTTQSTNAMGAGQSVITGDQGKYIAAGGVSNAASMVTQWYLKQAQNLLPTINVGSGRPIWIVMADKVQLPKEFFKQNPRSKQDESIYSYFSNILN